MDSTSRPTRPSPNVTRHYRRHQGSSSPAVATPSPRWKESLRQACLNRARRKRRDLILRKRQELSFDFEAEAESVEDQQQPARMVVEEELRSQGVAIYSACFDEPTTNEDTAVAMQSPSLPQPSTRELMLTAPQVEQDEEKDDIMKATTDKIKDDANALDHVISENDLYEILQEVEEELHRDEDLFIEEILNVERQEQLYIQDQIVEFEQWEESIMQGNPEDSGDQTLCPICQNANLIVEHNRVVACPLDACTFRWKATMTNWPLKFLREQLKSAHEEHDSGCCSTLRFAIHKQTNDQTTLIAYCADCALSFPVT